MIILPVYYMIVYWIFVFSIDFFVCILGTFIHVYIYMCKYNCLILPSHRWFAFTFPHLWFSRLVDIYLLSIPHFRRCGSCGLRPFVCPSLSLFRRYNGIIWYNFALLISWTMIHITFRWNTFISSVVHVISWYLMIFHRWTVGHFSLITTSKSQSPW